MPADPASSLLRASILHKLQSNSVSVRLFEWPVVVVVRLRVGIKIFLSTGNVQKRRRGLVLARGGEYSEARLLMQQKVGDLYFSLFVLTIKWRVTEVAKRVSHVGYTRARETSSCDIVWTVQLEKRKAYFKKIIKEISLDEFAFD